jgi:hypothetical protein
LVECSDQLAVPIAKSESRTGISNPLNIAAMVSNNAKFLNKWDKTGPLGSITNGYAAKIKGDENEINLPSLFSPNSLS